MKKNGKKIDTKDEKNKENGGNERNKENEESKENDPVKFFLSNEICNFRLVHGEEIVRSAMYDGEVFDVFSAVFFKRNEYYKNFGIYVRGIVRLVEYIRRVNEDITNKIRKVLLLFIDKNILADEEIMNKIKRDKRNLILVKFDCPDYYEGNYHIDLFGTLVRFFPMFNFPNNPFRIVYSVDVDLHTEDYERLDSFMKNSPMGLSGMGTIKEYVYEGDLSYMFAGCMCYNREKYDHKYIIDFIKNADKVDNPGNYGKRVTPFGFGIDEIFINDYFQ